MPSLFTEDTYEQAIIELFENMGYDHLYAPDFDRDYTSPLLDSILRDSLVRINRGLPVEAIDEALAKLKNFGNLMERVFWHWHSSKCSRMASISWMSRRQRCHRTGS